MKVSKIKYIANFLTSARIVGAFFLLLFPIFSIEFYCVYTFCGISDILDGFIARKTKSESRFGATLDSIADVVFLIIASVRLLPHFIMICPAWCICTAIAVALIRIAAYICSIIRFHRFAALHTVLNKLTGAALFLTPYFLTCGFFTEVLTVVCLLAVLSSIEELVCVIKLQMFDENVRGAWNIKK